MCFHGDLRQAEVVCDLFVQPPAFHCFEHAHLGARQAGEARKGAVVVVFGQVG